MDIQSKVAARRAELERQAQKAEAESRRIDMEIEEAKKKQRDDALDKLAVELSDDQVEIQRKDGELFLTERNLPPLDVDGLKKSKIEDILNREARKLWTPGENWQVIGCIVSGLCFIYLPIVTILLLIVGWARRSSLNQRYRAIVRDRYPQIFNESSPTLESVQ